MPLILQKKPFVKLLVNLSAVAAPAGLMPVVLEPAGSGVLLHEAVGHGLEDFNRKESSFIYRVKLVS